VSRSKRLGDILLSTLYLGLCRFLTTLVGPAAYLLLPAAEYIFGLTPTLVRGKAPRDFSEIQSLGRLSRRLADTATDPLFTQRFNTILRSAGVKPIILPARSPNLNAYAERFVKSIRSECLDKMIFLGEEHLRATMGQYLIHYHQERNHQGLDNKLIAPDVLVPIGQIRRRKRIGGLLKYYYRKAA